MRGSLQMVVVGGCLDGDRVNLPAGAGPGFTARLRNASQTTDYEFREAGDKQAMVARGLKWPIG